MKYLSVCSGIEAASVAWHGLGFEPVAFSEIEPFPSAVLKHHYPNVPNLGDMTKYKEWNLGTSIDILVGGTPCQSFSVAGLRKGLDDPRGNLMLVFLGITDRFKPRWIVWENVPGVLSSGQGRDFGSFLGALAECGYGFAYRVLDAQNFGVPQRRRRVFVVGYLGDYRRAAAVLFEPESLCRDIAKGRKTGEEVAGTIKGGSGSRGYPDPSDGNGGMLTLSPALRAKANASHRLDTEAYVPDISPAIKARDYKGPSSDGDGDGAAIITAFTQNQAGDVLQSEVCPSMGTNQNATGRNTPKVMIPLSACFINEQGGEFCEGQENVGMPCHICRLRHPPTERVFSETGPGFISEGVGVIRAEGENRPSRPTHTVLKGMSVRRLTPRECERLQGFPDDYTMIPWRGKPAVECPDGPRYKALGNSMAVPVMRWIGERIKIFA